MGFAARAARSARSVSEEDDRSRKGDVDRPIRGLVSDINALGRETVFTTSSCSGRVSLVAEQTRGKRVKGEAKWILMSHDPVAGHEVAEAVDSYLQDGGGGGGDCSRETLTLRFEPFILAVECANVEVAAEILKVGREAGFRESGIQIGKRITLSIRCSIRLELPVCRDGVLLVTREYLGVCCELCDEKFSENFARIERFHRLLKPKVRQTLARATSSAFHTLADALTISMLLSFQSSAAGGGSRWTRPEEPPSWRSPPRGDVPRQ